jgi:hypothetical protein
LAHSFGGKAVKAAIQFAWSSLMLVPVAATSICQRKKTPVQRLAFFSHQTALD